MEIKDNSVHGNGRYHGYVVDFAAMLARRVGFQYEIKLVKDAKYGNVQEDGEWTGMVGEVIRKVSTYRRIQDFPGRCQHEWGAHVHNFTM